MDLAYDISRLVARIFSVTPNGIDRIDFAFAEHLMRGSGQRFGIIATGIRPRLYPGDSSYRAITVIGKHWGEQANPSSDLAFEATVDWISRRPGSRSHLPRSGHRISYGRPNRLKQAIAFFRENGFSAGRSPGRRMPHGASYINVSQFPLWNANHFDWLSQRRDIKAIFFIHDLLPLNFPAYFPAGEFERHQRRVANLARFGAAAIVSSETIRVDLIDALRAHGRTDMPILVAPVPVSPVFKSPREFDPRLTGSCYFLCCSTIEPRKNHLLLLDIWSELVAQQGIDAPKLILIGKRGWKCEAFDNTLKQNPRILDHVIEVAGLTSPAMRRLFDNAKALLMPSFAEGYGLPVREALARGLPVVASKIDAFRDLQAEGLDLLSPVDGQRWLSAIQALGRAERKFWPVPSWSSLNWSDYILRIEDFAASL